MKLNLNIRSIQHWTGNKSKPFIIAGPCSAETPEQLRATAKALTESGNIKIDVLRAGIWKPRTRPNSFEGAGVAGLQWLSEVKNEFNIPVGTEVANSEHIELALKHNIDVLWIGARTTVSPFSMQEMADALKGVDNVTVLVKNPTHPEVGLWIGAFERLNQAGVKNLGAIHRGFSSYEKTKFRNQPLWQLPIELRRLAPEIPIINDPSHISGKREYIKEVAQKALDLNFDGLMIETHIEPEKAWSDADQQVTPSKLEEILSELIIRKPLSKSQEFNDHIEEYRSRIDRIDSELLGIIAQRMEVVEQIGRFKKENNVITLQIKRWEEVLNNRVESGKRLDLDKNFITDLYKLIHEESIRKQGAEYSFAEQE